MKKTIARSAAAAAITVLALAGCGSTEEEPVAAPTIEETTEEASDGDDEGVEAPAVEEKAEEKAEVEEEKPAVEQSGPGVYQAPLMSGGTADRKSVV